MADVRWRAVLSRRSFLQYTALSAGLLTLSRLRVAAGTTTAVSVTGGLQVLSPSEANILTVVVERMVFTGAPEMPAVRDTHAIQTIDRALLQLDASLQTQLRWLLKVFEWGPPFFQFNFTTFTHMSDAERDRYLLEWDTSQVEMRRLAFRALKNLSVLGYYSQDATWKGIHYDGPWVPRPKIA